MTALSVYLQGVSVLGPGLPTWEAAVSTLCGRAPHVPGEVQLPVPMALAPPERRRVGVALKLALAVAFDACAHAGAAAAELASVFSSTGGDCDNCHHLLTTLASSDRAVSPTRFHNSVHNMPAGYWSLATHCRQASTSLAAYDGTFAAGLLEAATQVVTTQAPCLLVAFDTAYPEPLYRLRPIPHPFGVGMVLTPQANAGSLAQLRINLTRGEPSTRMSTGSLEQLRASVPAARALPVLHALAHKQMGQSDTARCVVDYLDDLPLAVQVASA